MEDINGAKALHGHYAGKRFWWIENVLINNEPSSIMVMYGSRIVGDKACYRISNGKEVYFEPNSTVREEIILQGKMLIKEILKDKDIKNRDGSNFDWEKVRNLN